MSLSPSDLAPNLWIGDGVRIGAGVSLGVNVVIYAGTVLEDGVSVQDGVVLGKAAGAGRALGRGRERSPAAASSVRGPRSAPAPSSSRAPRSAPDAIVGDQAHVREGAQIGDGNVVGRGSAIGPDAVVGARVRIQTNVWLTAWTTVEDDVFVGPGVVTMNDDTMARLGAGERLRGPILRRACRVGGGVLLAPGVEVGEEAFVAAGAVVARDVPRAGGRHGRARARHGRGRRGAVAGAPAVIATGGVGRLRSERVTMVGRAPAFVRPWNRHRGTLVSG